jgi:hypothetical protein
VPGKPNQNDVYLSMYLKVPIMCGDPST